jgi:S-adenosylmethionine decarboxylase
MQGLHLTADLGGCVAGTAAMTDPAALRAACLEAVAAVGLKAVGELFHRFAPLPGSAHAPGVTGVVLLAESHLAVHTWPERGVVTLDVYVCNLGTDHSTQAEELLARLQSLFAPAESRLQRLQRALPAPAGPG